MQWSLHNDQYIAGRVTPLAGKGGFGGCLSVGGPYAESIDELAWMAMLGADGCI